MKIKKIIDLCKKSKRIILFNDEKNCIQWISDGYAIYPLLNSPTLTDDYICKLYDITDSQRNKIFFTSEHELPNNLCFDDSDITETDTDIFDISITTDCGTIIPIMTEEGLMFIQNKYLVPFSDVPKSELFIYTRKDKTGKTVFAIKIGLLLYAIISPVDVINDDFVNKLRNLYHASVSSLNNKKIDDISCKECCKNLIES